MYVCYFDEAGCTGQLPSASAPIQPAFVVCATVIHVDNLRPLTYNFLDLKKKYFPNHPERPLNAQHYLGWILPEIKGNDVRKHMARGSSREKRHAHFFTQEMLALYNKYDIKLFGRVWIKGIGAQFAGVPVYTSSVQYILSVFQKYLEWKDSRGFVIGDSRLPAKNSTISHGIFTNKFRAAGDSFSRVLELPVFGHSENKVGLQLTDFLASAIIWPMAVTTYCQGHVSNLHVKPEYEVEIKGRYKDAIRKLQYRYQVPNISGGPPNLKGGLVVRDDIGKRPGKLLFQ